MLKKVYSSSTQSLGANNGRVRQIPSTSFPILSYHKVPQTLKIWQSHLTRQIYESESNENLNSVIKIRNTARLSCTLATVILMVLKSGRQVAVRWRNATRRRSNSVKMAAHLQHAPKRNSVLSFVFYEVKGWNPLKFIDEWKFSRVMHVCHYSKCTNGIGSS